MRRKNRKPKFYAIRKGFQSNVIVNTMQEAQAYLAGKDDSCETISFDEISRMKKERTR